VVALAMNGHPEAAVHERRVRQVLDALYRDLGLAGEEEETGARAGREAEAAVQVEEVR